MSNTWDGEVRLKTKYDEFHFKTGYSNNFSDV